MDEIDCVICFCPIDEGSVKCGNHFCDIQICDECFVSLVTFSEEYNHLPQCPGDKCRSYYLYPDSRFSKDTIESYRKTCINWALHDKGDTVKKSNEQKELLAKIRQQRKEFLAKSFPASIVKVANLAFKSKMSKIDTARAKRIEVALKGSRRICMNLFCNGHLGDDMNCIKCSTQFCDKCEKAKKEDHKCIKSDIESVQFINKMIRCPHCNIPVHRASGCNSITCANCSTKFDYSTGEKGGHGSTNAPITLREKSKLSVSFKDLFDTDTKMTLMIQIEAKEPPSNLDAKLITRLKHYYNANEEEKDKYIVIVTKAVNDYFKYQYFSKYYFHILSEIEAAINKKELTEEKLQDYNKLLTN